MKPRAWPFHRWEDWHNGLYDRIFRPVHAAAAADVLSEPDALHVAMIAATVAWPYATETIMATRREAGVWPWLGQAACLFAVGAVKRETCHAWGMMLSESQRDDANGVANSVVTNWMRNWYMPGGLFDA